MRGSLQDILVPTFGDWSGIAAAVIVFAYGLFVAFWMAGIGRVVLEPVLRRDWLVAERRQLANETRLVACALFATAALILLDIVTVHLSDRLLGANWGLTWGVGIAIFGWALLRRARRLMQQVIHAGPSPHLPR